MPSLDDLRIPAKPPKSPSQEPLDLAQELVNQYHRAQDMLRDAEMEEAPLNYRTQTLNAISSIISQLVKLQSDLHTLEEIKKIESALSVTLKKFPEIQEAFFAEYETQLQ